ncbi:MAG TPA: hypothetical protein VN832_03060 [Stellaceae bacterium]|nr:hypothetical protein [Stellaceae bacterium]
MTDASKDQGAAAPSAEKPEASHRGAGAAVAAVLIAALLIVGSAPYWAPQLLPLLPWGMANSQDQRLDAVEEQSRGAVAAVTRIERQAQSADAALAALSDQFKTLRDRVAALEQRPAAAPDVTGALAPTKEELSRIEQRLDALAARLDKLAAEQTAQSGNGDRMLLLAAGELRSDVVSSRPYVGALEAVAALARDRPELAPVIARLQGDAATGVPGLALLAARFSSATAPAILSAGATAAASSPEEEWWQRILARIERLVVIRRVDKRDPIAAAVAEAQAALDKGEIGRAVAVLQSLSGAEAAAAASWLAEAQRRLAAEAAVDALTQQIALHLAGSDKPEGAAR